MKKQLRVISLILALSIVFSITAFAADSPKEKYNYVLLGDSIARGAGIINPDEASYGLLVANTNGYNYANHGIDGSTSSVWVEQIEDEAVMNDVKKADIISLSVGGNDFLSANIISLLIAETFTKDFSEFYKIRDSFYENFCKIIEKIRSANPDALLLVQTLYNMRHDILMNVNQRASDLLNECYRRYLDENPGAYVIVDVAAVLDGRWDCLSLDTIHPSSQGAIEIARLVIAAAKEAGMGEATEPVILIDPIDIIELSPLHLFVVIKYYINYFMTH